MDHSATPDDGNFSRLIDEQLQLAAARLPALHPGDVHPVPGDHDEIATAHPTLEDVLLGRAEPTPQMLEELVAFGAGPAFSDEELARQALSGNGGDGEPATPAP